MNKAVQCRNSHRRFVIENVVLKNFAIYTGKHLYWNLFLIKLQASFIKKRLTRTCFSVNIAKFLRKSILKNICERLLLAMLFNPFLAVSILQPMNWCFNPLRANPTEWLNTLKPILRGWRLKG